MAAPLKVTGGVGLVDTANPAFQTVTLATTGGYLFGSSVDGLTATAGGGQTNALPITSEMARISTVATVGDSVKLPPSVAGLDIILENAAANSMQVYGLGTDTINGVATATGVSQMSGSVVIYTCYAAGAWYANGLGTGYSGSFETASFTNGITAFSGGGQSSAVLLTSMINRVTTVAAGNDSVKLPVAVPGMQITVVNAAAANSMNLFPNTGDAINALGANAAFAIAANKAATLYCANANQWHAVLTA